MKKNLSKTEVRKQIKDFFASEEIKNKSPREIKKIKRIAMRYNVQLKEFRKEFCKKCLAPYKDARIKIKNKMKIMTCGNCGYVSRWRLK